MPELRDPNTIIIRQELRQRQRNLDFSSIKASIASVGQINAITIRREPDGEILVAGWSRLMACRDLGIPVKVDLWENLDPDAAEEIELEENAKRTDLHWRDHAATIGKLHVRYGKTQAYTAGRISLAPSRLATILAVYRQLNNPLIESATSTDHAYSILERAAERRTAQIVHEIMAAGAQAFGETSTSEVLSADGQDPATENTEPLPPALSFQDGPELRLIPNPSDPIPAPAPGPSATPRPPVDPIISANFLDWITTYTGPKFNLIHVDFPYGIKFDGNMGHESDGVNYDSTEDVYWTLLNAFTAHFDRICSYHAHVMFWFDMNFYSETKRMLETTGLFVQPKPLIWHKTDDKGIIPGRGTYPRHVYESAFLCVRARRPLIKHFSDTYGAPTASPAIHPSQKPEPMLRYFFSGLVDETTDLLDPCCGSGTAIRAAEDLGARSVLGLELNPDYYSAALAETRRNRLKRQMRA